MISGNILRQFFVWEGKICLSFGHKMELTWRRNYLVIDRGLTWPLTFHDIVLTPSTRQFNITENKGKGISLIFIMTASIIYIGHQWVILMTHKIFDACRWTKFLKIRVQRSINFDKDVGPRSTRYWSGSPEFQGCIKSTVPTKNLNSLPGRRARATWREVWTSLMGCWKWKEPYLRVLLSDERLLQGGKEWETMVIDKCSGESIMRIRFNFEPDG